MFTVPWWAFQVSCRYRSYKQPRQQPHQQRHTQPTKTHSPTVFLNQHIFNLPQRGPGDDEEKRGGDDDDLDCNRDADDANDVVVWIVNENAVTRHMNQNIIT